MAAAEMTMMTAALPLEAAALLLEAVVLLLEAAVLLSLYLFDFGLALSRIRLFALVVAEFVAAAVATRKVWLKYPL